MHNHAVVYRENSTANIERTQIDDDFIRSRTLIQVNDYHAVMSTEFVFYFEPNIY